MEVFVKLRALREERGISVERLAAEAETSASNIRSLEKGDSTPGVKLAIAIARYLGVAVEDIEWGQPPDAPTGKEPRAAVA